MDMVPWPALWWMIPLTAAAVFVASCLICMATPIHKNDYRKLGDKEPAVLDAVRAVPAGTYMFPFCTPKEERTDPAAAARVKAGPWGILNVVGKQWSLGPMLGLSLLNMLIIAAAVAWVVRHSATAIHTPYQVFRIAAVATFLGHGGGCMPQCIWGGRPWSQLVGMLFDAAVYALLTGAAYYWLWPKITA